MKDITKCERAVRALPTMTVLSKTLYNYRHSYLDGLSEISTEHPVPMHTYHLLDISPFIQLVSSANILSAPIFSKGRIRNVKF